MALFGMSQAGKDAQGNMQAISNTMWQQAKDSLGEGATQQQVAKFFQDKYGIELQNDLNTNGTGIATAGQQRQDGFDLLPGLGEYDQQVLGANATADATNSVLDQYGQFINRNHDANQNQIGAATGDQLAQNDTDTNDILAQIRAAQTAGKGSVDTAFNDRSKNLDLLKPGGDARAARVGRSFLPVMAALKQSLRKGGALGTAEDTAATTRVGVARARQMDDSLADDTGKYVAGKDSAISDKNSQMLSLLMKGSDDTKGTLAQRLATALNIKSKGTDLSIDQSGKRAAATADYYNAKAVVPGTTRANSLADWQNKVNASLTGYNTGKDAALTSFNTRQQVLQNLGGAGTTAQGNSNNKEQLAMGQAGQAQSGYANTVANSGGWLGKVLTSLGGAAVGGLVNYATGGVAGAAPKKKPSLSTDGEIFT